MEDIEIWKDIMGYEGLYQISSFGRVKSLSRNKWNGKYSYLQEDRILVQTVNNYYYRLDLYKEGNKKNWNVHKLVALCFLNHKTDGSHKLCIDHIDGNKLNNNASNLQLISNRENCTKDKDKSKTSSKYIGVSWSKQKNNWIAYININKKRKHLGIFENEYAAHLAYQEKLKSLNE